MSDETKKFLDDIVALAKLTTVLAERQLQHSEAIMGLVKRLNEMEARQFVKEHTNV